MEQPGQGELFYLSNLIIDVGISVTLRLFLILVFVKNFFSVEIYSKLFELLNNRAILLM